MDNTSDNFFQVSVKGLFFDDQNRLLLMLDSADGRWDLPGGRLVKGEDLTEGLQREWLEEIGVECRVVEKQPSIAYSAIDQQGRGRIVICYKVALDSLDFKPSNECIDVRFFTKDEMARLSKPPQLEKLVTYL